jgi:hypothetical protein
MMKHWIDKLRECTPEHLNRMLRGEQRTLATTQRSIDTIKQVLSEKAQQVPG